MSTHIFVNLPVKDLPKSMDFFKALGYSFNLQFTDDTAACLVISENIFAMLLTHDKFKSFIPNKTIADARTSTEVLIALSTESRAAVDKMVGDAIKAGGREYRESMDYGFMYQRAFEDLDGHVWEITWMDPAAVEPQA